MSETPGLVVPPDRVDPERLSSLLQQAGWRVIGRRRDAYLRLARTADPTHRQSILIPLDREAPEFGEMMTSALVDAATLSAPGRWTSTEVARLVVEPTDGFRFRKESTGPSGLIAWPEGEELITSARATMAAGAKGFMEHLRYFNNKYGQFANRYLDMVLMGQTAPGSYVVTALSPARGFVPLTTAAPEEDLFGETSNAANTRSIGLAIVTSIQATVEAIEYCRATGSYSAFETLVSEGVSYEMTTALKGVVQDTDGADISVSWDPAVSVPGEGPPTRFVFQPTDAGILERAASRLVADSVQPVTTQIVGRVHLLTKAQAGGPGVVGLEILSGPRSGKVRVHLSSDDYHRSLQAHDQDRPIVVTGRLEREGNLYWLYDSRVLDVLDPIEDMSERIRKPHGFELEGQLRMEDAAGDGPASTPRTVEDVPPF